MKTAATLLLMVCLSQVDGTPDNVKSWLESCAKAQEESQKRLQSLAESQKAMARTASSPADKKKLLAASKDTEGHLEKLLKGDVTGSHVDVPMPANPGVGQIGYVSSVKVTDVLNASSAIVELTVTTQTWAVKNNALAPTVKQSQGVVIISGVDTTKWPNNRAVSLDQDFEATSIDQAHDRLVVLTPFDTAAWKGKYEVPKSAKKKK